MRDLIISLKPFFSKIRNDQLNLYAAQSCFYITLSFFPFIIVLMGLFHFIPISPEIMINTIKQFIPEEFYLILGITIDELYRNYNNALTSITAIATIWSASKGFMSIIKCFHLIYDSKSHHNYVFYRFMSIIYTFFFIIALILSLILIVFGNTLVKIINIFIPGIALILSAVLNNKFLLLTCLLFFFFDNMYVFIPKRKSSFLQELPGAVFASIGWCAFTYFYSLYVNYSPNFTHMYGTLAAVVFALIWMYFCFYILFLGAELNVVIKKRQQE